MPTMASLLVRAARDASAASRAACSAAAVAACAARSAAFAATCAARSAAAHAAADRAAPGAAAADPSHAHWSGIGYDARGATFRDSGVSFAGDEPQKPVSACFSAEKDLESDEALWALYERWCKHYNQERDPEEMAQRFDKFKKTALHVHQVNKSNLSYKLGLNQFSDGKLAELCLPEQGVLGRYELETRSWS
ncbi:hypothetical protein EJB05_21268 [Eragrostis curvula]|uniref:Cathepsin propeptide inhibitor domain-containing protein n=1 Tax=Eragrostis curvula TaxID=38414 RepID=A0A5J9V2W6_9POAL|nr:hypothetical protein EJB05_21268 [Eragrostis curvula]